MALSKFAGEYRAWEYAYGINVSVQSLLVDVGTTATGAGTLTVAFGAVTTSDGTKFAPLSTNAPITVGSTPGSDQETVTPTAVNNGTPNVYNSASVTATFTYTHGQGETIASGTIGLQEAINAANAGGGGLVIVDYRWAQGGGTTAMLQAAVLPTNGSVIIEDRRSPGVLQWWKNLCAGAALAAPSIPLISQVASLVGIVGTWTAATTYVNFTYVDAEGGETVVSSQYSFTATASLAIGGSGPIASTGAVGYRVYMYTTTTTVLCPVNSSTGTPVQCGPIAAFAIGTPFSIPTLTTTALAIAPGIGTAFVGVEPTPTLRPPQAFRASWQPLADQGIVATTATASVALVQLPAGYLNYVGRSVRLTGTVVATTNATSGTLALKLLLHSVYGVTSITPFTSITTAQGASALSINLEYTIEITVTKAGTAGTLECHGRMFYNVAGTTGVGTISMDLIHAASSTVDLTKQDCLEVTVTPTTTGTTALVGRQLEIEPIF